MPWKYASSFFAKAHVVIPFAVDWKKNKHYIYVRLLADLEEKLKILVFRRVLAELPFLHFVLATFVDMSKLLIISTVDYSVRVICCLLKVLRISLLLVLFPVWSLTVNIFHELLVFLLAFEPPRAVDIYAFSLVKNRLSHFDISSIYWA